MDTKIKKINWQIFRIVALNWMIFAMIMAVLAIVFLMKDRKAIITKFETCEYNWELVEKQMGSGRVILELNKTE